MTLGKAAAGVVTVYGGTFRIGFGGGDETEFFASNLTELGQLWREFCEENGFKKSSVDYVEASMDAFGGRGGKASKGQKNVKGDNQINSVQEEKEAAEVKKHCKIIEIDRFERFFAVEYPPAGYNRNPLRAMVGIYQNMLFWKEECSFQFLEPVRDIEKAYRKKVHDITHQNWGSRGEREYTVLTEPIKINRLYWSRHGFYADARYVEVNG